jgi:hypothetical protein
MTETINNAKLERETENQWKSLEEINTRIVAAEETLRTIQDAKQKQEIQNTLDTLRWEKEKILSTTQQDKNDLNSEQEQEYIPAKDEKQRQEIFWNIAKDKDGNIDMKQTLWNMTDMLKQNGWILGWLIAWLLQKFFWWKFGINESGEVVQTTSQEQVIIDYKKTIDFTKTFEELLTSKEWKNYFQYQDSIIKNSLRFDIPPAIMLQLFIKEWSNWDPKKWPGWANSAVWLGQITGATWDNICKNIGPRRYGITIDPAKRYDPESQILAACMYLDYCKEERNTATHKDAIVYYHQWPGPITDSIAQKYARNNPIVMRELEKMWVTHYSQVTVELYSTASNKYYLS